MVNNDMESKNRIYRFFALEAGFLLSLILCFYLEHKIIPIIFAVIFFILSPVVLLTSGINKTSKNYIMASFISFACFCTVLCYSLYQTFVIGESKVLLLVLGALGLIFSISLIVKSYKCIDNGNN